MLKRYKKPKVNGLAGKPACASISAEKVADEPVDIASDILDSDSDKLAERVSQRICDDGSLLLVKIFSACGLCITEEPSNILRM